MRIIGRDKGVILYLRIRSGGDEWIILKTKKREERDYTSEYGAKRKDIIL